jgi:hypothetical protein
MERSEPLHSESHRTSILTPTIALIGWALIIMGFWVGLKDGDWSSFGFLIPVGALLASSHWFLAPRRYNIYENRVVITYGRPRVRAFPFDEVSSVEVKTHSLGAEVRVQLKKGGYVGFAPQSTRPFHEALEDAFNHYHGFDPDSTAPEILPGDA